jgi:transposase
MASALLDGAADIFERGGRKPVAEVDEEMVRSLHAKIGELAVANDLLSRKLKPWTGK